MLWHGCSTWKANPSTDGSEILQGSWHPLGKCVSKIWGKLKEWFSRYEFFPKPEGCGRLKAIPFFVCFEIWQGCRQPLWEGVVEIWRKLNEWFVSYE